jgi:hypothetical protein
MLRLWRRHLNSCAKRKKGRDWTACSCPIWCDGDLNGKRYRASLDTRDWQRSIRKLAALEDPRTPEVKSVEDAIAAFENHIHPLEAATKRKYKNVMAQLREYCNGAGIQDVMQITVERLDGYRPRNVHAKTAAKAASPSGITRANRWPWSACGRSGTRAWGLTASPANSTAKAFRRERGGRGTASAVNRILGR